MEQTPNTPFPSAEAIRNLLDKCSAFSSAITSMPLSVRSAMEKAVDEALRWQEEQRRRKSRGSAWHPYDMEYILKQPMQHNFKLRKVNGKLVKVL